jgi:hypothetical protein
LDQSLTKLSKAKTGWPAEHPMPQVRHSLTQDSDCLFLIQEETDRESAELKVHRTALDGLKRQALTSGRETQEHLQAFSDLSRLGLDKFRASLQLG